jgi:HK97 family phage major capsid protein
MKTYHRTFAIERNSERAADGVLEFALSSEMPVERWFGTEVLSHAPEAVNLERLADGRHPLLLNHDTDRQIGVVERAWLDDGRLRVAARFSRSPLGQEIKQDVDDNIRQLVSVGYFIDQVKEEKSVDGAPQVRLLTGDQFEREMRSQHGEGFARSLGEGESRKADDKPPVYTVTRWTPFEASVVPVPADTTVGKGRAQESAPPAPEAAATPSPIVITETRKMTEEVKDANGARVAKLVELGATYSKYVSQQDVADACRGGKSVDQFLEMIVEKQQSKHTDTRALDLGMTRKEAQRYSFGKLIRALTLRNDDPSVMKEVAFEMECSRAMEVLLGATPNGVFVPYEIMRRDFNVGTATEAGNLVPTNLSTDLYVDALRAAMVVPQLGVRVLTGLSGNIDIPRKATPSALAGVTEIGSAAETNPTVAKLTLSPKRVSAYVEPSKQAIIQSAIALEGMIRDDLVTGAAVQIENYMIQGSSAANGTGLIYRSGLGTVTEQGNGTNLLWDHLVDVETAAAAANAEPDRLSGYLINTQTRGKAKKVQRGTNLPFIWENGGMPLNGYRAAVTNNVPANLTKGTSTTVASALLFGSDWSMAVLGFFGGVDVTVDPFTKADTGQVKITLNQFWDYTVRQPAAIVVRKDILTT